jgi:hypothetical protein
MHTTCTQRNSNSNTARHRPYRNIFVEPKNMIMMQSAEYGNSPQPIPIQIDEMQSSVENQSA